MDRTRTLPAWIPLILGVFLLLPTNALAAIWEQPDISTPQDAVDGDEGYGTTLVWASQWLGIPSAEGTVEAIQLRPAGGNLLADCAAYGSLQAYGTSGGSANFADYLDDFVAVGAPVDGVCTYEAAGDTWITDDSEQYVVIFSNGISTVFTGSISMYGSASTGGAASGFVPNTPSGAIYPYEQLGPGKWAYRIFIDESPDPWNPIDPPVSEFNEVVDYIYDPVLNNTFGTSTVGATFSIPQPSFLTSVGVELYSPTSTLLWSDTLPITEAGTFDVSTSYDFTSSGGYELRAFFILDTGERVDNPVSLFIVVNTPEWVVDPGTGDFVPVGSTTIATSTLTNFNLSCPDDVLAGTLCKLAVGLFIPKVSSVQALQASFYSLMNKAPFSFFTQSKTILDSFRTGTGATGGSLSLTFYGQTAEILSTTTAAAIGVGPSQIDGIKGIMIVGLWLMLAWYLYWRIASIFGV